MPSPVPSAVGTRVYVRVRRAVRTTECVVAASEEVVGPPGDVLVGVPVLCVDERFSDDLATAIALLDKQDAAAAMVSCAPLGRSADQLELRETKTALGIPGVSCALVCPQRKMPLTVLRAFAGCTNELPDGSCAWRPIAADTKGAEALFSAASEAGCVARAILNGTRGSKLKASPEERLAVHMLAVHVSKLTEARAALVAMLDAGDAGGWLVRAAMKRALAALNSLPSRSAAVDAVASWIDRVLAFSGTFVVYVDNVRALPQPRVRAFADVTEYPVDLSALADVPGKPASVLGGIAANRGVVCTARLQPLTLHFTGVPLRAAAALEAELLHSGTAARLIVHALTVLSADASASAAMPPRADLLCVVDVLWLSSAPLLSWREHVRVPSLGSTSYIAVYRVPNDTKPNAGVGCAVACSRSLHLRRAEELHMAESFMVTFASQTRQVLLKDVFLRGRGSLLSDAETWARTTRARIVQQMPELAGSCEDTSLAPAEPNCFVCVFSWDAEMHRRIAAVVRALVQRFVGVVSERQLVFGAVKA